MPLPHFGGPYDELYYHRSLMSNYSDSCKAYRKKIKWNKVFIVLCIFNLFSFIFTIITDITHSHINWYTIFSIFIVIIWLIQSYFTIKTIRKDKIRLNSNIILCCWC